MAKSLGVRAKIYVIFAVPLIVLSMGSGLALTTFVQHMRTATDVRTITQFETEFTALVAGLRWERALAVAAASATDDATQAALTTRSDEVKASLDKVMSGMAESAGGVSLSSPAFAGIVDGVDQSFTRVQRHRERIVAEQLSVVEIRAGYDSIIDALATVPEVIGQESPDPQLARLFQASASLELLTDAFWDDSIAAFQAVVTGSMTAPLKADMTVASSLQKDMVRRLNDQRTTGQLAVVLPRNTAEYQQMRDGIAELSAGTAPEVTTEEFLTALDAQSKQYDQALKSNAEALLQTADTKASEASRRVFLVAAAIALTLLVSVLAVGWLAHRMAKRLQSLTTAAGEVQDMLPNLAESLHANNTEDVQFPVVDTSGNDEISHLAVAFNDVNQAVMDSIRGQAELRQAIQTMFVNIARRDQVLLGRQLAFLDQLESQESNPETLAGLFRLDHLATRMRRNAESLLVLAGIETGRRPRKSMVIADVMRVAASEIEDYDRVDVSSECDLKMLGHHALTASHLIAELLENASRFSNPGTRVHVTGVLYEGFLRVEVTDSGIGMTADEVRDANDKIASPISADYLTADKLGLYVVGQLARKLGAHVVIESGQDSGSTARVDLPIALFEGENASLSRSAVAGTVPAVPVDAQAAAAPQAVIADVPDAATTLLDAVAGEQYTPAGFEPTAAAGALDAGALAGAPAAATPGEPVVAQTAGSSLPTPRKSRKETTDLSTATGHMATSQDAPTAAVPQTGPVAQSIPIVEAAKAPAYEPEAVFQPAAEDTGPVPLVATENTAEHPVVEENTHTGNVHGEDDDELRHPDDADFESGDFDSSMRTLQGIPPEVLNPETPVRKPQGGRTILPTEDADADDSGDAKSRRGWFGKKRSKPAQPVDRYRNLSVPSVDDLVEAEEELKHPEHDTNDAAEAAAPAAATPAPAAQMPRAQVPVAPTPAAQAPVAGPPAAAPGHGVPQAAPPVAAHPQAPAGPPAAAHSGPQAAAPAAAMPVQHIPTQPTAPPIPAQPGPTSRPQPAAPVAPAAPGAGQLRVPSQPPATPPGGPEPGRGKFVQPAPQSGEQDVAGPSPMESLEQDRKQLGQPISSGIGDTLRQRSEIASQVLAELSMLSNTGGDQPVTPLARRKRGATAPPPMASGPTRPTKPRDAGKVRSTLSGFTAGAARARKK